MEPAPAPDELQAGALWANNIARIAALAVDQKAAEGEAKDELKKKQAKEADKEKQNPKPSKPEEVKASTIVENQEQLELFSPPILQFCKLLVRQSAIVVGA